MRTKLSLFAACLAGTMLLVVPGAMAAMTVTGITPSSGQAGAAVQCTVTGTFNVPLDVDVNGTTYKAPEFTLDNGVDPPIAGTTNAASVTSTSASVSFPVTAVYPAVWYTLRATQLRRVFIVAFTDKASLPHAFEVVPTILSLSPDIAKAGADVTLTVDGGNFVASSPGVDGSSVRWGGDALATTFSSATKLTAIVPAARLTTAGTAEVTVTNVTAGTTSAPRTFTIDTTKPSTEALNAVRVKRNSTAKLKFRIGEPAGQSPSAQVVIRIKAVKGGGTVKSITIENVPVNAQRTCGFKVTLKKGAYKWYVYATDLAGNTEANIASASFSVK